MRHYYITFRSVTFAQRGEQLLNQGGFTCTLLRTPKWMESQGCGYSLRVPWQQGQVAVDLLRGREVPFRKIYLWNEGKMEEAPL